MRMLTGMTFWAGKGWAGPLPGFQGPVPHPACPLHTVAMPGHMLPWEASGQLVVPKTETAGTRGCWVPQCRGLSQLHSGVHCACPQRYSLLTLLELAGPLPQILRMMGWCCLEVPLVSGNAPGWISTAELTHHVHSLQICLADVMTNRVVDEVNDPLPPLMLFWCPATAFKLSITFSPEDKMTWLGSYFQGLYFPEEGSLAMPALAPIKTTHQKHNFLLFRIV